MTDLVKVKPLSGVLPVEAGHRPVIDNVIP